jgi:hypothetical protein
MALKPFKDITDRDFFAGLIMAPFGQGSGQADGRPCQPRRRRRPTIIAALKVPVGGKPPNAMRGRRQDDIDDRNA